MKIKKQFHGLTGYGLMFIVLVLAWQVAAANQAVDLKTLNGQGALWQYGFLLETRPCYILEPDAGGLVLTLLDTQKSNLMKQKTAGPDSRLVIESSATHPADLRCFFALANECSAVKASWSADQKVFYLEIAKDQGKSARNPKNGKANALRRVRFGIQEPYTRLVLDFDQRPLWKILYPREKEIILGVQAGLPAGARKAFGPLRRVKEAILQDNKQNLEMHIQLEADPSQLHLALQASGKRLVLDLWDQPHPIKAKDLGFLASGESATESIMVQAVQPVSQNADKPALTNNKADKAPSTESGVTGAPSQAAESLTDQATETARQIPDQKKADPDPGLPEDRRERTGSTAPVLSAEKTSAALASDLKIELQADIHTPGIFLRNDLIKQLNGDEAFLFGRIQEAWENKDFEKGAGLIARFLKEHPQSSLNESLAFLEGDFLLALMKSGRKEILPLVIRTYQNAATHFENSSEVPYALLKVAQTYAFNGDYYNALGNLSIIITNFPKGDHLASAYLTRGKVELQLKQAEKAIADFKYILEHFPKTGFANEARYGIAEYFHREAVYDEAERRLKEIEENDRHFYLQYPEYLFLRAKNFFFLKEYDVARDYYFRALNLGKQPEPSDLLLAHIADTYFQQERHEEAGKFYRLAVEIYPQSEGAAIARIRLAGTASGVSGFQEVVEKNVPKPIHDIAMLKMANKQYAEHHYAAALQTLETLIAQLTMPGELKKEALALYVSALEGECNRLFQAGQYEELIRFYQSRSGTLPAEIRSHVLLMAAQAYHENRQYGQAVYAFLAIKASDLPPESKSKYILKWAESYLKLGEWQKSEELLKKGLRERLAPVDQQRMTFVLARIQLQKGDWKKAYQLVQSIIDANRLLTDHEMAGVYLLMGQISVSEGKYEKAREALNRCIALAEKDKHSKELAYTALAKIADSYHLEGRHDQALKYYQESYAQGFDRPGEGYMDVRFRQAISLIETGENKAAQEILSEIAEEGDFALQQRAQMKLGMLELTKQLRLLHLKEASGAGAM